MGRGVIVIYRPKKGRDAALLKLVKNHIYILRDENLVSERNPIIMKSAEGCIVEIFEWKSTEAIAQAHSNHAVQNLWEKFSEVCDYEIPVNVKEFHTLFSEFEIIG